MLISDQKEFVFVHVAKTAGTSIRAALKPYSVQAPNSKFYSFLRLFDLPKDYRRFKFPRHAFLSAAHRKLPPDIYQNYFKFAVVRNPWDRLVSCYHSDHGLKQDRNPNKNYKAPPKFFDYLEKQRKRENFQLERITDLDGQIGLDFMLRFERIDEDIKTLADKLDVSIDLPRLNPSLRQKASFQDYYDQESRNFVARHWQREIEMLDYKFDG